jgi:hypothetical protein
MKARLYWLLRMELACVIALQFLGCGSKGGTGSGSTGSLPPTTPDTSLTGNWQFQAASTIDAPFTSLSGFVNEEGIAGDATTTTASLQVQSTGCFSGVKVLDFEGFTKSPLVELNSFPSDSQVISFDLNQQCTAGASLCGTYSVVGGCGDKATGTVIGTKYALLTGMFSTSSTAPAGLQMTINQSAQGTGQGNFQVSGSMSFTGISCATSGTIDPTQSFLSGSTLQLVVTINAIGSPQLTMYANVNSAATTIALTNVTFAGSSCFQSLNAASLSKT